MIESFVAGSGSSIIIIFVSLFILGWLLPSTRHFSQEFEVPTTLQTLWGLLKNIEAYPNWRRSLQRIDQLKKKKKENLSWLEVPYRGKIIHYQFDHEVKNQKLAYTLKAGTIYTGLLEYKVRVEDKKVFLTVAKTIVIKNPILKIMGYIKLYINGEIRAFKQDLLKTLEKK